MPIPVWHVDQPVNLIEANETVREDASGLSSEEVRHYYMSLIQEVRDSTEESQFWHDERLFGLQIETLEKMSNLAENWDSYGAPIPAQQTINCARLAIEKLRIGQLVPEIVSPSAEGGVSIYFSRGRQKAFIEFLNEGDVLLARYGKDDEPHVEVLRNGLQDLNDQALQEIRDHLAARA
jgi:hypothetical protein